jgi:hypothetical protein
MHGELKSPFLKDPSQFMDAIQDRVCTSMVNRPYALKYKKGGVITIKAMGWE